MENIHFIIGYGNYLNNIKTDWVGFCQYRKFFVNKTINEDKISFSDFENCLIKSAENNYRDFDCILGEKFSVENYKLSKIIKNHFCFLRRPSLFFDVKKEILNFILIYFMVREILKER